MTPGHLVLHSVWNWRIFTFRYSEPKGWPVSSGRTVSQHQPRVQGEGTTHPLASGQQLGPRQVTQLVG